MGILTQLGGGQGYLKAGFLGFPKSGKTFTAVELALGVRKQFGLAGPIAFFDTESGSEYVADKILKATGLAPVGVRSRSFSDLVATARECMTASVSVLIVDSITHPWRELCESYLKKVNEGRAKKNLRPRGALEFQDWGPIKEMWNREWTAWYLNSLMHVIICGRAGFEYDMEVNEETGKKELNKVGVKMKTEAEFGFEPSLLVEMERVQEIVQDRRVLLHRATVLGDRFGVIDGATCDNPTFEFFAPHVDLLNPGKAAPVDTEVKTDIDVNAEGDADWQRERRTRTILSEEIAGILEKHYPGTTAENKKKKAELIERNFGTLSKTAIENMDSSRLRRGLDDLRATLDPAKVITLAEGDKSEEQAA
jgi:hypothetical protein